MGGVTRTGGWSLGPLHSGILAYILALLGTLDAGHRALCHFSVSCVSKELPPMSTLDGSKFPSIRFLKHLQDTLCPFFPLGFLAKGSGLP